MKTAKIFFLSTFLCFILYGLLGLYFLPLATFQGDLSRMAMLPERLLGWQRVQPAIDQQLLQQSPIAEADVFVIGDSFSDGRIWQSVLTANQLKVHTLLWGELPFVCEDASTWLRAQGFNGRYIVIETNERNLPHRLNDSLACKNVQHKEKVGEANVRSAPIERFDVDHGDYSSKMSVGLITAFNTFFFYGWEQSDLADKVQLQPEVFLIKIGNGCSLFSHLKCDSALFYSPDSEQDVDPGDLQKIKAINARLGDVVPIWVVVPNKATTYLYQEKHFWNSLEQSVRAPNLLAMNLSAIKNGEVDLYPGNNTHYSTRGYLLMGDAILKEIRKDGLNVR
jgi:hypothetical protein